MSRVRFGRLCFHSGFVARTCRKIVSKTGCHDSTILQVPSFNANSVHTSCLFSDRKSRSKISGIEARQFHSLLLKECRVLRLYGKRIYHTKPGLLGSDSSFVSFLQSLATELKAAQDEQIRGDHSFKPEKDKKIFLSRYNFLTSSNEVISKLFEKQSEVEELKSLSSVEIDSSMKELMESEIHKTENDILELEEELVEVLAGEEPADSNDIILEVNAGVGGQEAMLFCAELYNMYCQYCQIKGWNVTLVGKDASELGGYRKAAVEISGMDVYKWLKYEAGVHRVQRIPKTEKAGRIHTSTVTVSILPQPKEIDIQIEKKDLKIETFRGSGPGGQSVNTTDSAVRITHLPTGIVAECKQERSQLRNREYAMKTLKSRIYQVHLAEAEEARRATRKMHMGSRGRSEKIRTYNFQQDRVTDHRVKENLTNLPNYMALGEGLDDLIDSLDKDFKYKEVESMLDQFKLSQKNKGSKL